MSSKWKQASLGELCEVKGGKRVPKGYKLQSDETPYPYISVRDFSDDGTVSTNKLKYADAEIYEQIKNYTISSKDVYLSIAGTIGKSGIVPKALDGACLTENACKLVLGDGLYKKFLYYYTLSDQFSDAAVSNTRIAAQPKLSLTRIKTIPIPVPPLEEQKRIVEILDEAFEGLDRARAYTEANLQNAKDLFESRSISILTQKEGSWVKHKLSEVCEKITDGTHQTPKYFDDGYIFLSSRNVKNKKIDWTNIKYIDEKQHIAMHKRIAPKVGDVLLAKNGTTGVAAIVDRDVVFDIYVSLAHLRALECLEPRFLLHFVNSSLAKTQFNSRLKGQGVPNLHLKEIREVQIEFPEDKAVQRKIVNRIESLLQATTSLEENYKSKLKDVDDLRQSLLQKAFAGELT